MSSFKHLPRRKIRYWCSRFQTEEKGGAEATGAPEGLKEYFEQHKYFQSWTSFGITWDIDEEDSMNIVPRKKSIEQEWNETLERVVPELPSEKVIETETFDDGESVKVVSKKKKRTRKTKKS